MLPTPRKRICPSLSVSARSKTPRQSAGLTNGSSPSMISISANAPSSTSQNEAGATRYFFGAPPPLVPRIALKNSLPMSTIITSLLLRKLAR